MKLFKVYGPSWMGYFERRVPYPLRAARPEIAFTLFPWWKPSWSRPNLTEWQKSQGATIWRFRWMWVEISYSRWL